MRNMHGLISVICTLSLCVSCYNREVNQFDNYSYREPKDRHDGITTSSLDQHGIDVDHINTIIESVNNGKYGDVQGVLAASNNELVIEEYDGGENYLGEYEKNSSNTPHEVQSVVKSITSLLVGIAIDKGFIAGVDEKVFPYFPEYRHDDREQESELSIKHLLTMTSGIEWDEHTYSYLDIRNDMANFYQSSDPIGFFLNKRFAYEPGKIFNYCGANTNILGEIVSRASGMPLDEFADLYLWKPMGIKRVEWNKLSNILYCSGLFKIRERDLLKIGLLVLNNGIWNGQRLISEEWLAESFEQHYTFNQQQGYGYSWWIVHSMGTDGKPLNAVYALGWGGQHVCIFPDLDVVFVITAGNYEHPEYDYRIEKDLLMMFM